MSKKLIEVALPLEAINAEAAREKSIRHGHPSTLHLWWARRPLAAARAVIWSSLVDDPSAHPELYPTEEAQNTERQRLFGILDADTLARAKNTSVAALAAKGVLSAEKGIVRLLTREELPEKVDPREESIWLLCQQLTRAMETGGVEACAQIVAPMLGSNAERAKDLAYRLYTLAERKGWTQEGYAYNALVVAWREIQSRAAELQQATPEQTSFF